MPLMTDNAELERWLSRHTTPRRLALDTEFMRESTYTPTLALIQVNDGVECTLIDPLAPIDLVPLVELLKDPQTLTVWHSGRQDWEVLWPLLQQSPANLWDTQIGAAVLGLRPQMGYAELVATLLDVPLDKSQTRTDWLKRPLSDAQVKYALDDVRYLLALYEKLVERLSALGRIAWWAEEMQSFCQNPPIINPELAFERLKGLDRLTPLVRTRLCRLSIWREQEAQRLNIPRSWITDDGGLERMARGPFPSEEVWPRIPHPNVRVAPDFNAARTIANDTSVETAFEVAPLERPSEAEKKRLEALRKKLSQLAASLTIDETFLCPSYRLKALARGASVESQFSGWRLPLLASLVV